MVEEVEEAREAEVTWGEGEGEEKGGEGEEAGGRVEVREVQRQGRTRSASSRHQLPRAGFDQVRWTLSSRSMQKLSR